MIDRESSRPARVGQADARQLDITALIAMGWVLAVVYGFLQIIADVVVVTPTLLLADGITLLAAWAVIEQKRWGRYLLLGISLFTLMSALHPFLGLTSGQVVLNSPQYAITAIGYLISSSHGFIVRGGAVAFCALTVIWLRYTPVKARFNERKAVSTHAFQLGIAMSLLAVWSAATLRTHALQIRSLGPLTGTKQHRCMHKPHSNEYDKTHREGSRQP